MLDEVGSPKKHFDFRINCLVLINLVLVHERTAVRKRTANMRVSDSFQEAETGVDSESLK